MKIRFKELGVAPHRAHLHTTLLQPGQATRVHTHDFFEVFLVVAGEGVHRINRREVALRPGCLVAVRPEDGHGFLSGPSQALGFVNVAVAASWWRAFHQVAGIAEGWERLGAPRGHCLLPAGRRGEIESRLKGLGPGPEGGGLPLAGVWRQVAEAFQRADPGLARAEPPEWLEAWRRELAEAGPDRLAEPIGDWQRRSGRTPEHLARSCRRYYGVTPSAMLGAARIDRVKLLLRAGNEKVITVAMECGFQNMAHFHRLFATHAGMTPRQWRRDPSVAVPL